MQTEPPRVSVVVATYERCDELLATLDELLANTAPAEVVIVDDGSTDDTAQVLRRRAESEPRLKLVVQANAGEMAARLSGARAATGEVVLLLDDDVVPAPGVVAGHAAHHAETPNLLLMGYMPIVPAPPDRQSYPRDIYARTYEQHCCAWERDPQRILHTLWAGHMSMPRELFIRVAESMEAEALSYHKDMDFGLRCAAAGAQGAFDRRLASRHLFQRTPEQHRRDATRSGLGLALVHAAHPEALGPAGPEIFTRGGPRPVGWLVLRSSAVAWPRRVVDVTIAASGRLRLFRVQRYVAGVLWRMLQLRGFLDHLAEDPR